MASANDYGAADQFMVLFKLCNTLGEKGLADKLLVTAAPMMGQGSGDSGTPTSEEVVTFRETLTDVTSSLDSSYGGAATTQLAQPYAPPYFSSDVNDYAAQGLLGVAKDQAVAAGKTIAAVARGIGLFLAAVVIGIAVIVGLELYR